MLKGSSFIFNLINFFTFYNHTYYQSQTSRAFTYVYFLNFVDFWFMYLICWSNPTSTAALPSKVIEFTQCDCALRTFDISLLCFAIIRDIHPICHLDKKTWTLTQYCFFHLFRPCIIIFFPRSVFLNSIRGEQIHTTLRTWVCLDFLLSINH